VLAGVQDVAMPPAPKSSPRSANCARPEKHGGAGGGHRTASTSLTHTQDEIYARSPAPCTTLERLVSAAEPVWRARMDRS
jgi:hypothetical protein